MINKHAIDRTYKLSKICAIGSLAVLIPFLAYGIWSDVTRHPEPISRIFYDVEFRVLDQPNPPPLSFPAMGARCSSLIATA